MLGTLAGRIYGYAPQQNAFPLDDTNNVMYFTDINGLKAELADAPMSPRRVLPYVGFWFALLTLDGNPQVSSGDRPAEWWFLTVFGVVAAVIGVWVAYRANGGDQGDDFVSRLVTIWWVVSWRILLISLVPLVVLRSFWAPDILSPGALLLFDLVARMGFTVVTYWRVAVHLAEVRNRTHTQVELVPSVI